MKRFVTAAAILAIVLTMGNTAMAQDPKGNDAVAVELEVTMVLLPQGAARPEVITKSIELPRPAAASGGESEQGRDTADEARDNRQDGLDTAAEARERGREFGQDMAEQARENREDAGRGGPPDEPPGGPPENLPLPELPED